MGTMVSQGDHLISVEISTFKGRAESSGKDGSYSRLLLAVLLSSLLRDRSKQAKMKDDK